MSETYVVNGSLTDARTVALDQAVPISSGRVRVVVELLDVHETRPYREVMDEIRARQLLRGHQPPSPDTVDERIRVERESWGE